MKEKDAVQEYIKQFKSNTELYQKDLAEWSESELAQHYQELETYYGRSIQTDHLLGRFDDPNNEYYWHNIDEQNPVTLERRLAIGWSIVNSEDEVGMKRSQDPSRLGSSSVVRSVKQGQKALLLRIPKSIKKLNDAVKQKRANNESLYDHNGKPLKITYKGNADSTVKEIDAGFIKY